MSTLTEIKTYSLSELKKMPKEDVIKLDMRQLPLPKKVLNYFNNRYEKLLKQKEKNPGVEIKGETINFKRYPSTSSLYIFSLANILLSDNKISGERGKSIYNLCLKLRMKHGDIFSFNYHLSFSKQELLNSDILNLRFPNVEIFWDIKNNAEIETLSHLLHTDPYDKNNFERFKHSGPVGLFKIKNHLLKMGFKMGEYPFLNKDYWERIDYLVSEHIQEIRCIVPGFNLKRFGIVEPYVVKFGSVVPFKGSFSGCIDWLNKHSLY